MSAADFLNVDIASHFNLLDGHQINVTNQRNQRNQIYPFKVNGALFKVKSFFIVNNKANYGYTFGKIIFIVFVDQNNPIFAVKYDITDFFVNHSFHMNHSFM
jgi:hypothetical protein